MRAEPLRRHNPKQVYKRRRRVHSYESLAAWAAAVPRESALKKSVSTGQSHDTLSDYSNVVSIGNHLKTNKSRLAVKRLKDRQAKFVRSNLSLSGEQKVN